MGIPWLGVWSWWHWFIQVPVVFLLMLSDSILAWMLGALATLVDVLVLMVEAQGQ